MPDSITAVLILIVFIMPGFVWQRMYSCFVPQRFAAGHHFLLECLARSALIHSVFSPVSIVAVLYRWDLNHLYLLIPHVIIVLLIAPFLFAVVGAKDLRERRTPRWLEKFGLNFIYPIPTAWDWLFWNMHGPSIALVTLKDGRKLAGGFGSLSFVGDSHHERDIFLEKSIFIDKEGKFLGEHKDSVGIWVTASDISVIEFFKTGGIVYEQPERGEAHQGQPA